MHHPVGRQDPASRLTRRDVTSGTTLLTEVTVRFHPSRTPAKVIGGYTIAQTVDAALARGQRSSRRCSSVLR